MLLNYGIGEDSWESPGLQGDPTSPSSRKSVLNIHWKDWCWSWNSSILATWCEELTPWKRPWCWEILKAGGEGDGRGWDGWMASPTQWTWVWASFASWWWTGKRAAVHGVAKSWTRLSDWTEAFIGFHYVWNAALTALGSPPKWRKEEKWFLSLWKTKFLVGELKCICKSSHSKLAVSFRKFSCLLVTLISFIRHCNFPCAIETSPVFYSTSSLYLNSPL